MVFGPGRGRGMGRSAGYGMGRGMVGGRGFGFRGSSPPWPYVGMGRGGLPRCGYFVGGYGRIGVREQGSMQGSRLILMLQEHRSLLAQTRIVLT
jgi:hypothetical protein